MARRATHKFALLFSLVCGGYSKPKLHYAGHILDCWEHWEELISCFGAESKHKEPKQIMAFCYNQVAKTALAKEARR